MNKILSQDVGFPLQHQEKHTDALGVLKEKIQRAAGPLIKGLTVEIRDSAQIILQGQSQRYYGKQLAQVVAMQEMGDTLEIVNLIEVK